jgi:hypothetical protein
MPMPGRRAGLPGASGCQCLDQSRASARPVARQYPARAPMAMFGGGRTPGFRGHCWAQIELEQRTLDNPVWAGVSPSIVTCVLGTFCHPCVRAGHSENWSGRRDLNPRPSRWQRDALPLSYTRVHGPVYAAKPQDWQARLSRSREPAGIVLGLADRVGVACAT